MPTAASGQGTQGTEQAGPCCAPSPGPPGPSPCHAPLLFEMDWGKGCWEPCSRQGEAVGGRQGASLPPSTPPRVPLHTPMSRHLTGGLGCLCLQPCSLCLEAALWGRSGPVLAQLPAGCLGPPPCQPLIRQGQPTVRFRQVLPTYVQASQGLPLSERPVVDPVQCWAVGQQFVFKKVKKILCTMSKMALPPCMSFYGVLCMFQS